MKDPDPDGFRAYLARRAAASGHNMRDIGDGREVGRRAMMFGLSGEDARGILKSEGWTLKPTPSGSLYRWHPPEKEGQGV